MIAEKAKTDIRKLELDDIKAWLTEAGEASYRAGQIYEWLWQKHASSFEEMSSLSKALRSKLAEHFAFYNIQTDQEQFSDDGTIKSRFRLHDGPMVESVLIPVAKDNRFTVCVSTQVGCSLTCSFCATGKMKRLRNLDPAEIVDQVVKVNIQTQANFDHSLTNIVYMGMGEPLLNYKNTLKSIEIISSPKGLGMSPKRITVSTAGIAKMITKLADDQVRFNLALSLHAADDAKRDEIMPINGQNNLEALMESLQYFYQKTGNRISYEYIAFDGFNDSIEDARKLVRLCKQGFPVKVNIIEYNPVEGVTLQKSRTEATDAFAQFLRSKNVMVTIRRSRGKDIDAACGQLANKG